MRGPEIDNDPARASPATQRLRIDEGPGKCNVSNVHHPSIAAFLPDDDKATGTAIIIAPGAGRAVETHRRRARDG